MPARAPILLAAAVSLSVLVGCTVTSNITDEPAEPAAARTVEDGVEVWDLREPPTAADVGIQPGEKTSDFQTGVPRRIRLLLPEGFELETVGPLLGFDNYGHPHRKLDHPERLGS